MLNIVLRLPCFSGDCPEIPLQLYIGQEGFLRVRKYGVTTFFPPKIPAKAPVCSGTGLNEASSPVAEQQRKQ